MKNHRAGSADGGVQTQSAPRRAARVLASAGAVFALLLAASCGSKAADAPGTSVAGNAGSSGASAAGTCSAGDTRFCVGPGACSGGQACGLNGQWSACDCGGAAGGGPSSGGSASVGGSSGGPASGSAGATQVPGSGGIGGKLDSGGAAGEAGAP